MTIKLSLKKRNINRYANKSALDNNISSKEDSIDDNQKFFTSNTLYLFYF